MSRTSGDDHDPAAGPTARVPVQRVSSSSTRDGWLIWVSVAVVIALGAFWVGRQSTTPTPAASPAAALPTVPAASRGTALPSPLLWPAVIPADLEAASAKVVASDTWAVCQAGATIRCQPASRVVLTPAEAQAVGTAWPRLQPARVPPGETIVAARPTAIAYALFISLGPEGIPTILDPVVSPAGLAFLDLGPYMPAGCYVVMIAGRPNQPATARSEAIGLQTDPC